MSPSEDSATASAPSSIDSLVDSLDVAGLARLEALVQRRMATSKVDALEPLRAEYVDLMERIEKAVRPIGITARKFLSMPKDALVKLVMSASPGTPRSTPLGRRSSVPPRFRNPDNLAQTWSGRGRQPDWVAQWISAHPGATVAQLRIDHTAQQ